MVRNYNIKTIYPKEEIGEKNKLTERSTNEFIIEMNFDEVLELYKQLLTQGYSITVTLTPPELMEDGATLDPFEITRQLELNAIPYKATLKLKATGSYEEIVKISSLIEKAGFDFDITSKLKINENSPIDFAKEKTWFDSEYATYTITPKASSTDIQDLHSLYDDLTKGNQKVSISIKPKVKKDDDQSFAIQLSAYPEGTSITFNLTDADVYSE